MKPRLRCSGLDRLLSCPGSRTLNARYDEQTFDTGEIVGSAMTWRGNWCHWEAARRLIESHGAIAPEGGLEPPVLPPDWKPTQWEYRTAAWYVTMLLELTPPEHVIYVERELVWETEGFILTGHIDAFSVNPEGTDVHWNDQKTGLAEVDPADINEQIGGYGALLRAFLPTLKTGTARILQRSAERPVTEVEVDDMGRLLPHMEKRINAALAKQYELQTGKHCTYCPPIIFCPAVRAEITRMKLTVTPEQVARLSVTPDLEELAAVAYDCKLIATPAEKILELLRERLAKTPGNEIALPNGMVVRLTEERGRRTVTHPKAMFDLATSKVPEDRMWECMSISLTELEDALVETGMKRSSKTEESATSFIKQMSHLYEQPMVKKMKFVTA